MMRYLLLLLLFFNQTLMFAQIDESFDDGDFSMSPTWAGTGENFIVNASNRLQLDDDEATQSWLSTGFAPAPLDNKEWNFWVKHSFSGSSNNFTRIYLSSIQENLSFIDATSAGAEGYFLLLGEAGSEDAIRLFRDGLAGEEPVEILAGSLGQVAGSFELGIRVIRDDAGNWTLFVDPDGGTTYQLEATGNDATYNTSSYVGMVCTYTISNATNFQFDDIYFGDQFVDEVAPEALTVSVIDNMSLDVQFSEPLDQSSAENVLNYSVNEAILNPATATLDGDPSLVHLEFASNFVSGAQLTLAVSGVEDLGGNPSATQFFNFAYYDLSEAISGDVVFNELMADPTPALGLPEAEFVELYNPTNSAFSLNDWEFINTTTSKVIPNVILPPGGFILLCDEEFVAEFEEFGTVVGIPSFTALSNAGDSLTLLNANDDIIDIVAYESSWYGDDFSGDGGVTLERINPQAGCSGAANWSACTSFQGGTPGEENSIFSTAPDTNAPNLLSGSVSSADAALFSFDEALDIDTPDQMVVSISPDLGVSQASLENNFTGILVQFDSPFEIGTTYTVTISNVSDCSGNIIANDLIVELVQGFEPQLGDLLITEIMADPDAELGSPNAEYVELYNRGDQLLELTSLTLNSGTFIEQVLLAPGEYVIVTNETNLLDFLLFPNTVGMDGFPGLTNSGTTITLFNALEEPLDQVSFDIEWYGDPEKQEGGYSLELINPDDPCSDLDNWTASNASSGATPGAVNSVNDLTPDTESPNLVSALVTAPDAVQLFFDEQLDIIVEDVMEANVFTLQGDVFLDLGYDVVSIELVDPARRSVVITFNGGFSEGVTYYCGTDGATDCWGNVAGIVGSGPVRFAVPEEAEAGDLIINEILSNPFDGGTDFVEIYNRSEKNLSIEGWQLGDEANGIPENFKPIIEEQFMLFPGEFLVLTESKVGVTSFYDDAVENRILVVEDLPTYSNAEGVVVLADSLEVVSDRVPYTEDWHYPLLDDTDGVSFERLNPSRSSTDATNWHSASTVVGFATPGYLNSQFSLAMNTAEVSAEPEVFSPDNDGFEDNCLISYTMSGEGFTGTLTIYDDEGRIVRKLVQNELLGISGTYSWDGISDAQQKSPIGIYIIYFEAFHPDGSILEEKITTVLGHRLN